MQMAARMAVQHGRYCSTPFWMRFSTTASNSQSSPPSSPEPSLSSDHESTACLPFEWSALSLAFGGAVVTSSSLFSSHTTCSAHVIVRISSGVYWYSCCEPFASPILQNAKRPRVYMTRSRAAPRTCGEAP